MKLHQSIIRYSPASESCWMQTDSRVWRDRQLTVCHMRSGARSRDPCRFKTQHILKLGVQFKGGRFSLSSLPINHL